MKIRQIVIYGYGKWHNKTIDVNDNFIAFLGRNEMGKSTLQSFIQSMLFGLPKTAKKTFNSYMPKEYSAYGGKLILDDTPYGRISIERKDKPEVNSIQTHDGVDLSQQQLDDMLAGVTLSLYQDFFSLTINQLQSLDAIKKENLNRYFLTIGLSGSEQFFKWKDEWTKQSDNLYLQKGSKPVVNQQLEAYHQQTLKVDRLAQQQREYADFVSRRTTLQKQLDTLNKTQQQLEERLQFEKVIEQYQKPFERFQELSRMTYTTTQLDENVFRQYESIQIKKEALNKQLLVMDERKEETVISDELQWFIEHEIDIKLAVMTLPKVEQTLKHIATTDYQLDIQKDILEKEMARLSLTIDDLPKENVTVDEHGRNLLQQVSTLEQDAQVLSRQQNQINERLQSHRTRKVALENEIASSKRQSRKMSATPKNNVYGYLIVLMLGVVVSVVASGLSNWILLDVGVLIGVCGAMMAFLHTNKVRRQRESDRLQEQQRLSEIQEQFEHYHREESRLQEELAQLTHSLNENQQNALHVQQQIDAYKVSRGISNKMSLERIVDGTLQHVIELRQNYGQLSTQKTQAVQKLTQFDDVFSFFGERMSKMREDSLAYRRDVVTQFKTFVDKWQVEAVKLDEKNKQQQFHEKDKRHVKNQLLQLNDDEMRLFEHVHVDSPSAFEQLMSRYQNEKELRQEKDLLQKQLSAYMERLSNRTQNENAQQLQEQLEHIQQQKNDYFAQQAKVDEAIRVLETDGEYAEEKQKLALMSDEVLEGIQTVATYQYAVRLLDKLLHNGKSENIDTIIEYAGQLFTRITANRYVTLQFKDDRFRVKRQDDTWFELYELSMGTLDQLYIALRLAFIKSVSQRLTLPLIIDDCFVNFDEERRQTMLAILEEFSKTHQIIYLTYQSDVTATNAKVIPLKTL
ncbi:AAA family ATPase [Carnobacteriaceae bacterium zg-ZUI252]|nr:AAA family ATPase [Carnobacteriaceae bacterium zg-ZUI252]MBS4769956.1 AAA family ATPase [Carnobacteriaceae bacterium zg-ZUI240]